MKRKYISGITAIMMFATIFATPSIGFAANMNAEPEKNSTQTVETKEEKATKEAEEKETETKLEEKNSVQKKASVKATSSSEAAAVSDGVTGGSIYFDASTGTITDCDESVTAVILPEKINGVDVKNIGRYAFSGCTGLKAIEIPSSVTTIDGEAFRGCSGLTKVSFPESITSIGHYAFENCTNLEKVTLPIKVETMGYGVFSGCKKLTAIKIPKSLTSSNASFVGCPNLTTVTWEEGRKTIQSELLSGCTGLESVEIPASITSIGQESFRGCSGLTEVSFPESVTSIGSYAFEDCTNLEKVTLPTKVETMGYAVFSGCKKVTAIEIPKSLASNSASFSGCPNLTTITWEEGRKTIQNELLSGCTGLESIEIPASVTSIGQESFRGCSSLQGIEFPEGLTSIGNYAFRGCSGLTEVSFPESVMSIGSYTFEDCTNLEKVTLPTKVETMGYAVFSGCKKVTAIEIPKSLASNSASFSGCPNLTTITWEEGRKTIQNELLSGCTGLESIEIPASVTSIGQESFRGCSSLQGIEFPEGLTSIGNYAFRGCSGLTEVSFPESVMSIGSYTFEDCTNLEKVTLPTKVETMGYAVFSGCKKVTAIEIPKSLASNSASFSGCPNLTTITWEEGRKTIQNELLSGCTGLESIEIPASVTSIGQESFRGCSSLQGIEFPEGLTSIGNYAFRGCSGLTEVSFPESVMSIGSYTFEDCTNLEKVTLPTKVETMGYAVFSGCKKVAAIEIPKSLASNSASFSGCPNLTTITWEEGRKTIQNELLSGCTGLESIEIPASVTSIGNYAFSGCSSLQGIEFPEGLTSIGNYAFRGCSGLTEVSFPESVTSIGSYAFEDCTNLTKAAIPNSIKSIGTRAFYRCPDIVVYCAANSYACTYAMDNNLAVVLTDGTFETSNGVLNYDATYFETNYSAANVHNGYIPFSLNYAIKSNSFVSLSNMYVVVKLPSTAQLVTQTLTIDGEICTDYTENDGVITIPVTKRAGKIRFSVRPTDSSIMRSYAKFNYKKNGVSDSEVIGVIVDEIPVLSIEANSITDKKEINFKGVTTSNEEIKIYLDNRLVTTTSGNKSGSYQGTATIQSPKNGKVYTLKAVTVNDSGEEAIAITNVQYKEKVPTLASFQMIYRDSVYDLLEDGTQPRITFVPGNKFTFKIKFNNTENVDKVFVTSDRNNIRQKMKAVWDEKNGQYIASGFFEGTNSSYVPGELNVFYTTKVKPVELTIDDSWLISEEDIPEHWKNAKVEVQTQTEKQEKISIQLKNDIMISCEYEKLTVEEATEKLLGTTTESQQQSRSKLAAKAADASTLYKGLAKAGWKVFSGTVTAAVRKTDTNWELLLLNESGEYMEHFVLDFGKDKITKAYLSDLVGDVLSPKDIDQVYSFISTGVTAGVSWADQTININAARNEINHSNRTDAQKEYLNKTLDSYEEQAAIIALGRLIGTACQTAGVYTFMANPLAGGILIGAGMVFNDLILEIAEADLEDSIGYLRGNTTGRRMTMVWAIDPSGYVYEGVTGNRLKNVKATAYYKETEKSNPVIWDAAEYDQMNPLYTAADGTYAWDVPEGLWRVKYEKEGYETTYSEWMPVPPPQTEVNIGMTAVAKPAVKNFAVYDDYAQITFSQYMNPDTMSAITLKDPDGKDVSYSLEYDETEKNLDGKVLAKTFKLKFGMFYGVDKNGEYKLTIGNSLENYAGKKMEACTISKKYEKERMLVTPEKVTVPYGGTVEIPVEIIDSTGDEIFSCKTGLNEIAEVGSVSKITKDGSARITIIGNMAGETAFTISVPGTALQSVIPITVTMDGSVAEPQMDAVKGFVAVASGNSISLKWEAVEGAESYEIYRATDKNETYNQIGTTEKCNFTDQLEESGTYYYKVRGIKGSEDNKVYSNYSDIVSAKVTVTEEQKPEKPITSPKPAKPVAKKVATIAAKNFTKTYGNKPFSLGAKASSGGKLSYKSSDTKVATVNSDGRVTLKGPGKATITITAAATANYNAASKSVTITVKPKKVAGLKVKKGKKRMTVSWKRDKKVTGYQITYAQNKKFKKGKKTITISKNKTIKRTVKKLKARKTYYVKVRAYKKVGKMKLYGGYSKVKKVKTR